MTAEGGETEEVTEEHLRKLWGPLTCKPDFFDKCNLHSVNSIAPENYARMYRFSDCEIIQFQNEKGGKIWEIQKEDEVANKKGEGELELPAKVGVYIRWGKSRQG